MKKFNVRVNGKTYAVEVEEVGAGQGGFSYQPVEQAPVQAPIQAAPAQAAPVQAAPAQVPEAPVKQVQKEIAVAAPAGGELMSAPMPGTILDILVTEGQTVKKGEIILILEAMKMENEIAAISDGVVSKIYTYKGATVNAGDPMLIIA